MVNVKFQFSSLNVNSLLLCQQKGTSEEKTVRKKYIFSKIYGFYTFTHIWLNLLLSK